MTDQEDLAALGKLFLALSDKTRLRLLSLMAAGPSSVGYLSEKLNESQPKTSRHLAYLRGAGLVTTSRDGKWVYYEIAPQKQAVDRILRPALACLNGTEPYTEEQRISNGESTSDRGLGHTYEETHMSEWRPNEIEVHLL